MNYIGSKVRLATEIKDFLLQKKVPLEGLALDVFSGTGIVACLLKSLGFSTFGNDWQQYAATLLQARVSLNRLPHFKQHPDFKDSHFSSFDIINYLNQLPGHSGPFSEAYGEGGSGGRCYFSQENSQKIQAIRDTITTWETQDWITTLEKHWLIACLIESADRIANTASVYGAFLKSLKPVAQKAMFMSPIYPTPSVFPPSHFGAYCEDALTFLDRFSTQPVTLTYLDPPYNHRQYAGNYHILETIALWDFDRFTPRGKTGLRHKGELRSVYCKKNKALAGFDTLLSRVTSDYILFSYNNEGLLTYSQLKGILNTHCEKITFKRIPYKRFQADHSGRRKIKRHQTEEWLILGRRKASALLSQKTA